MAKVCVVVEHCDALNDEYESYQENRAVAGNPTIAENLIAGYMQDLIKKTYADGGIATDMTTVGGDPTVITEWRGTIYNYKYTYHWDIEQYDIIES